MTDLGIHGTPAQGWSTAEWPARMREVLDGLPPAFTTMWISDHLQMDGSPFPEGWTRLAYLAAMCPRFRFGHLVLSQSYRNPGLLGAMAATLQHLSGGRYILGLGAGWLEEEYRAFHYDYPSGGTRVAQLAEAIQLIKTLWTESPATFHGDWYHLDGAICERPDPPIPILVGTNGPKALKVVARHADWWCWDGPWGPEYQEAYQRLKAACAEIGRPFDDITLVAELTVSLPDELTNSRSADLIREIETLVDVGVSHIALNIDNLRELQRFVDEVVPHVRLERRVEPG